MLLRETANKLYGINQEAVRAYHKSHISNTKSIAVQGVAFKYILENGGIAIEIFFKRAQSAKVRQIKLVGKNDVIIAMKGDIHYVYCNITG